MTIAAVVSPPAHMIRGRMDSAASLSFDRTLLTNASPMGQRVVSSPDRRSCSIRISEVVSLGMSSFSQLPLVACGTFFQHLSFQ